MTAPLPPFPNARLLVVGDIMLDRYWTGATSRISPEAPVPVVKVGNTEDRLGGAANVALNIATLGCQVSLCGIIGNDEAGRRLGELLAASEINNLSITDSSNPTITKLRVMSRHQQLLRMDFEEPLQNTANEELLQRIDAQLEKVDAVVISDYAKGTVANPQAIVSLCKKHAIPVFVDPKGHDFARYRGASLITPNRSELEAVVGTCASLDEVFTKAETLRQNLSLDNLLVTLSEKGMALIRAGQTPFHMATTAKDVFDVTGAGDTVIATLAAAVAAGSDIPNAMRLANLAAGVAVGKLGTSTVSVEELRQAIVSDDQSITRGITALPQLLQHIQHCRQKGERIIFTNGCFDILHAGHVRYLNAAAALGDQLIVALNSDASITRLKGAERPIVPLQERMEVMAALNCVDWVISFDEDTPLSLIKQILPDTLVKGGDYSAEDIVGYEEVTTHGGKVTVLPFVDGCSTSSIVEKIRAL